MTLDPRLEPFIRKTGVELEAALRNAGATLPQGITGEMLARAILEDAEKEALSSQGKARARRMGEIVREVQNELPGGHKHPDFHNRLQARLKGIFEPPASGPAASA